ncbi:hypothetical protein GBAR_LOCUS2752 [Geodia barretti]|uniref:Uncharacterized protein n=1 Tax=Geodia barretti TaxID=519541 RepID=A0AA35R0Q0_GEOBA|nr:hypothetical protein GBAR_LOCUS2752 [Geodia barretti]
MVGAPSLVTIATPSSSPRVQQPSSLATRTHSPPPANIDSSSHGKRTWGS